MTRLYSAASFTSGAAARTSASTWASNLAKFFWNMPTSARAVLSNSALSFQVLTGSRISARHARQRGRHREAEIFVGAEFDVAQAAVQRRGEQRARHLDRHAAAGAVFAAGPAGVDQPAIDIVLGDQLAQHVAIDARDRAAGTASRSRWRIPAAARCPSRARCRRPSRCSRTGSDTSPAPATSFAIGGSTPKASAASITTFFGWPARPVREALGMKSSG